MCFVFAVYFSFMALVGHEVSGNLIVGIFVQKHFLCLPLRNVVINNPTIIRQDKCCYKSISTALNLCHFVTDGIDFGISILPKLLNLVGAFVCELHHFADSYVSS